MAGPVRITRVPYRTETAKARAFTLLELLLVIVVLIFLAGVVLSNMDQRTAAGKLDYAARQLANLLQLARSEAMATGKGFRVRIEAEGTRAVIDEEADPIKEPGVFLLLKTHWAQLEFGDGITCLTIQFDPWESQLKEQEAKVLEKEEETDKEGTCPPIIFHPDGTSDFAVILLGDRDNRNYTLTLNGLTGQIRVEQGDKTDASQK